MTDIKKTPRYQQMVANLKDLPFYKLEAALLKELANGTQWRIDAVVEAIDTDLYRWNYIDRTRVFEVAAMYNRLTTIKLLGENKYFDHAKKREDAVKYPGMGTGTEILAAFDAAVMHGYYQVADYLRELGASPVYLVDRKPQRAMVFAVKEGDERKMDYLFKAGESPSYWLSRAAADNDKKLLDFLLEKGADINFVQDRSYTAFGAAVRSKRNDMAHYLLSKGADLAGMPDAAKSDVMYNVIDDDNIEMARVIIGLGLRPDENDLKHAQYKKNEEMTALIAKHVPAKPSQPKPPSF